MGKYILLHIIFGLMYVGGAIWAIVSFLMYLFKDTDFDWTPVVILIVGVIGGIINFIALANKKSF